MSASPSTVRECRLCVRALASCALARTIRYCAWSESKFDAVASLGDEGVLDGGGLVEHLGAVPGVERCRIGSNTRVEAFGVVDDVGGVRDEAAVAAGGVGERSESSRDAFG